MYSKQCRSECQEWHPKLALAQVGEEPARAAVVHFVFNHFRWKIAGLRSPDAMCDADDIQMYFMAGILDALDKAKMDVGCPLAYVAQFGAWRARSVIRGLARKPIMSSLDDEFKPVQLVDPTDAFDDFERKADAKTRVVEILNNEQIRNLTGRPALALEILSTGALDPREPGFNKQLAAELECSPQRASQICQRLRSLCVAA